MQQMKRRLPIVVVIAMVLRIGPALAAEDPIVIKMGTLAPEASPWIDSWYKIAEELESRSPVPIEIRTYPGGVMGDEPDMVKKLKFNQLHMIGVGAAGTGQLIPEMLVLSQPFMFKSYDEVDYVVRKLRPKFDALAEERGLEIVGITDSGMISIFSQEKAATPQELFRTRVWIWDADVMGVKMAPKFNINAQTLGVPEVLPSLQTGRVETVFGNPTLLVAIQWFTEVNYHYPIKIRYDPGLLVASKKTWNKIPEEHREAFESLVRDLEKKHLKPNLKKLRASEAEIESALPEYGIEQIHFDPEEVAPLKRKAIKMRRDFVGELYSQELLDAALAARDEYRAQQE